MVKISAQIQNSEGKNSVSVKTGENAQSITISSRASGFGSSVNGGELLFLALATCYCNDVYREAQQRNITVTSVQVDVEGEFDGIAGHPAENVIYHVMIKAEASEAEIIELMKHTDTVAEIQNTVRQLTNVKLGNIQAISIH